MEQIPMGDVFESIKPESYYEGELERLSEALSQSDTIIEKLRNALKSIKRDINKIETFVPDDYELGKVSMMINNTLNKLGDN